MKLDKLLAMGAYAFQAFATLALVFGVSHVLPATDYGHYSLVVATAQGAAVIAFEWVRLAAVRFCSGAIAEEGKARLATVQATFAGAAAALVLVGLGASQLTPITLADVALGLPVALLMGVTDLQLVFLRASGSFLQFAALQCSRSFAVLASSIGAALTFKTANGALLGMAAGYAVAWLIFVAADPAWWRWRLSLASRSVFVDMARYGLSAAAASMIYLQVPLLLRWVARSFLGAEQFAGFSLAMDVLQKPFALATSAIGGILTPGVIAEFDKGSDPASPQLRKLYEAQLWCVLLLLGAAMAFLPEMCDLLVQASRHAAVLGSGPPIALIFAGHTLIQTTISIPGHLLKLGKRLIANAALELGLVCATALPALLMPTLRPFLWLWLTAAAVALAIVFGIPLLRKVPCARPNATLLLGPLACTSLAICAFWDTQANPLWIALKLVVSLLIAAAYLIAYRRSMR